MSGGRETSVPSPSRGVPADQAGAQNRAMSEIRKKIQKLEEDLQILNGERGPAGKPESALRKSFFSSVAVDPIASPDADISSGPAGGAYGATEQDMLNELSAAVEQLQQTVGTILTVLRDLGAVKRPI
jgi:hypothetical protein